MAALEPRGGASGKPGRFLMGFCGNCLGRAEASPDYKSQDSKGGKQRRVCQPPPKARAMDEAGKTPALGRGALRKGLRGWRRGARLLRKESLRRLANMGKGGLIGGALGIGLTACAIPALLGVVGFTSGGIAAGSFAAKMMSASAVAAGGGVPAGSTVAVLQSVGAAGLATSTKAGVTAVTASVGAGIGASKKPLGPLIRLWKAKWYR
uniref:Uncharacterized protein isoform X1 n=1 Tax=Pogona vitticeps TaxID=103695 RepID=A0A6J0U759_9SAUR